MANQTPKNISDAKLGQTADPSPYYWTIMPNYPENPGWTWILVPGDGILEVFYEWQEPAAQIFVLHVDQSTTPINGGENSIPVSAGDLIKYQLNDPGSDSIKLGFWLA